jgi:hypothetical protein
VVPFEGSGDRPGVRSGSVVRSGRYATGARTIVD